MQLSFLPFTMEHSRYSAASMMQARMAFPTGVFSCFPRFPERKPMLAPRSRPVDSDVASTVRESAISPVVVSNPGYVFDGWYDDSQYTEKWIFDTVNVLTDKPLYAR